MQKHLIFIFILLFSSLLFSQRKDSLLVKDGKQSLDSLNTVVSDTTIVTDSLKTLVPAKRDSVLPIQAEPLSYTSTIINKRTFLFTNYRYTGDLLRSFPLNFVKDLGFIGQPHETFIYGVGNNGISFLQDGVLLNNRYTNSLDLNFVQSEDVDSIEIIQSPRGFLYGPYNNPVTVNFITKDFVTPDPYSRIKYYEGPNGEAMIDGKFNSLISKRWNLSFQATNRSVDETYSNSEFGIWQVNAKLKYFLSNSVNISGSYYFVSANQGLNGGVDFDSLSQISNDPDTDLYDPVVAPALYPNRTLDVTQHNFSLRTLAQPFEDSKLDLSFYYRYSLDELRNFQDSLNIMIDSENRSYGAAMNYYYKYELLTLKVLGDYEIFKYEHYSDGNQHRGDEVRFSIGGLLSLNLLNGELQPSFYYKYSNWEWRNYKFNAMGGDVTYRPLTNLSFYLGYSGRKNFLIDEYVPSFEVGSSFRNLGIMLDIKYFSIENFHLYDFRDTREYVQSYSTKTVKGLGLIFSYKLWFVLVETNASYYFKVEDKNPRNLPEWQLIGGVYVNDLFFEDNLDLKTGFKFYYTGGIEYSEVHGQISTIVQPTNKLDFTLAGEIRGVAIFYFIWENLFGNQYYITPYYPMPERNIRFGLAWELFN